MIGSDVQAAGRKELHSGGGGLLTFKSAPSATKWGRLDCKASPGLGLRPSSHICPAPGGVKCPLFTDSPPCCLSHPWLKHVL